MINFGPIPSSRRQVAYALLISLIALLIVSVCVLARVPPVSRDALTHHLAVPKIYLQKGGMVEIKEIGASYFPQNLDLLYMLPLYFGNDIIPKYIHFAFALLTAWLIFGYLKKRLDSLYALFGVLLFLSLPVIVKLSFTVYVDLGLIFFSTASLLLLFKWLEEGLRLRYLLLSALACGLALGTKYNGLIGFLLLSLFVPFLYARNAQPAKTRQLRAIGYSLLFCAVALLVFSPWMIRNTVWTGNPIHPLFPGVFNAKKPVRESPAVSDRLLQRRQMEKRIPRSPSSPLWIRKYVFQEKWWQTVLIPVRIFFEGRDDDPRTFDGRLNPMLFFLPIFAFAGFGANPYQLKTEKLLLLTFSVLFFFYAYFKVDMRIRYIAPIIPPLVILAVFGLHYILTTVKDRFSSRKQKLYTIAVLAAVTAGFAWNALYVSDQFFRYKPLDYISGRVGRDEYITRHRPEHPVIQYVNENLGENSKILSLFQGYRRYYSDRHMVFNLDLFRNIVFRATSADYIAKMLKNKRITHLLIHYDLFNEWSLNMFTDDEIERLNAFFENYTRGLISKGGYVLLELSPQLQPND